MSAEAARIVGSGFLQTVTRGDLFVRYEATLSCGWMVVDDAVLLTSWYENYHGRRARFSEITDYEIAVNGRGTPDDDFLEEGEACVSRLLRRGVAFAWAALYGQHRQVPQVRMAAYVSAAPTLLEPDHFTGNVTFCVMRSGCPLYIDPARLTDEIVIALFTEDCGQPLTADNKIA
ncbi:hypothetical protein [Actinoallomurus sp. CA-150999]|uniref:hypothetical protein n=1 Tax=Actinoallomurus sp. CA-150999 TaxID=3239887 RepID=UPI003D8D5AB3